MCIGLYMDVHVPVAITIGLRRRGVSVLTAIEDGHAESPVDLLLVRAHELSRVVFTQDIRFKALAELWQREGREFSGLIFGHQLQGTIGTSVRDLELVAVASEEGEWRSVVEHVPF